MTKELKGFMCKISDVKFSSKFFSSIKGTASKKRGANPKHAGICHLGMGEMGENGANLKLRNSCLEKTSRSIIHRNC